MLNKHNFKLANKIPNFGESSGIEALKVKPNETMVTDGHVAIRVSGTPYKADQKNVVDPHPYDRQHGGFPLIDGQKGLDRFIPFVITRDAALEIGKALTGPKVPLPILDHAPVVEAPRKGRPKFAVVDRRADVLKIDVLEAATPPIQLFPRVEDVRPAGDPTSSFRIVPKQFLGILRQAVEMGMTSVTMEYYDGPEMVRVTGKALRTEQTLDALAMCAP